MIPSKGKIPLSIIPRRWHLHPKKPAPEEEETLHSSSNILAISESYSAPTMESQIEAELTRITTMLHRFPDQKQRSTLLRHLQAISDDLFIDIKQLEQPKSLPTKGKPKRSSKRDLIALEHQQNESNKKAKTNAGREAADIW
ncbi:hypothetical protein BDB00DRAFT_943874 [Zychaea mexicana]|uniref:uncharacterized protein n=1 Tax=Zychaea mexicana TaxID=64656 RepID=UPI0022FE3A78|nr:uncharacterized protein BDB00DRAFT_943874 [Zychaea mexicana]KAI9467660.1 hypothetical protein BDB00DRAFT_943874 [Zychaea mexicana]